MRTFMATSLSIFWSVFSNGPGVSKTPALLLAKWYNSLCEDCTKGSASVEGAIITARGIQAFHGWTVL